MAKQTWNTPIDKSVDWGGDDNTGGLPVSGEMIQKFIKESLDGKAGLFYYDAANNRYLVFGDESLKDEYLADPTKTELIIGSFDAPFNYSAEITLATPTYNSVMYGSRGNYLEFTFDIKNKSGASTGENATVTYTFIRNSVKQVVTEKKRSGDAVRFNIDNYLGEGTNTVIIGVMGQTSLAATTVSLTYQVVNLVLSDNYDISRIYDLSTGSKTAEVSYTISGYGTKIMEWYLDGVKLPFVKSEDEIVDVLATKTKYITLTNLQQGVHSLQFRAYTSVDGETFYTEAFYRDLIVYTGANSSPIIAVAVNLPKDRGVLGANDPISLYGLSQYVPYTLRFATYSPTNAASTSVTIAIDGAPQGTVQSSNGNENRFTFTPSSGGNKTITLSAGSTTYSLPAVISGSSIDVEDIEDSLVMSFDASQKSNNSSDRETWTDGTYTGTLAGFNFNNASGWVNGRLEMNAGASFSIDLSPLAGSPTTTGKTIELEWSTKNVIDDNEIICDLRTNGTGILITATKVSLVSADGVVIETEYKSEENVRVGFVINKATGTSNQHMSFIYTNGIVSRCETWAVADSYTSSAQLVFNSSAKAQVSLKQIRVYDMALSSDQMLNNYTIYRDTVAEMMEIYDRNDVYISGTATFSPDKMTSRLPVMIVTGDIPTLENTSDKDTQIIVDIEYTNLQDPTRSFTMKNAAMRPQGTSSMGYPKKNFRIYTRKNDGTILYDSNGREVKDKLYAFKAGSQPVDCWCLKADYAESSGTHNTGIARLWNKALYDARVTHTFGDNDARNINDATVLRTNAQRVAAENGYPYDVRTTIDGFPILLFYRQNANEELIFIGKYNFNNDKSTESVFGFKGIPNFDNSKMQCWEVLNNGNALALFTTVSGFDSGWKEAFEARYPDKSTDVTDLKAFCTWMTSVSQSAFATEKWEHLDVYKMAAYWVYLMRHAAADQFVKNAMFTSEDGQKWYYILYDNDTINGLINTGRLRIRPEDGRQTVDETGSYVFAGHDSRLWNMLEADQEFMQIVSSVDNALYSAGISYINTIKIFDEEQADKWVERVYNQDAQYKYIGPYVDNGINNLFMLQGKRDLHRKWWLAKRFSIYDAKYVSGTYKSKSVEIKCINGTPAGQQFTIKAGDALDYGYGINNVPRSFGITLEAGASHTFTTSEVVNLGDPIRVYGAPHIEEIDFSQMASKLAVVTVANAYDEVLGTMLKKLIVGKSGVTNAEVTEISGLKQLAKLEELDVQGMTKMTSIDLTSQKNLKTLKAKGSNIASATFAKGAPVERLELPKMNSLTLEELPYLEGKNISIESISNITSITIKACPKVSNDFSFIYNWFARKTADSARCSLVMDGVNWTDVNADQLIELKELGELNLKGKVTVVDITLEQVNALSEVYGQSAFDKNAEFFINAPDAIFISGGTEVLEGDSIQFSTIVFGSDITRLAYVLTSGSNSYMSIDNTGLFTTQEGAAGSSGVTVGLQVVATTSDGVKVANLSISVKARVYPKADYTTISGPNRLNNEYELFTLKNTQTDITGVYYVQWSLSGLDTYAEIDSYTDTSCTVKKLNESLTSVKGTLIASVRKRYNQSQIFSLSTQVEVLNDAIAETDAGVCQALFNAGFTAQAEYVTKEEAAAITGEMLNPNGTYQSSIIYQARDNIQNFEGFRHFTAVTRLPMYTCYNMYVTEKMTLPANLKSIDAYNFSSPKIEHLEWPATLTEISTDNTFWGNCSIDITVHPDNPVFTVGEDGGIYSKDMTKHWRFSKKNNQTDFVLPSSVKTIHAYSLQSGLLPASITINSDIDNLWYFGNMQYNYLTLILNANITGAITLNLSQYYDSYFTLILNGNTPKAKGQTNTRFTLKRIELGVNATNVPIIEGLGALSVFVHPDNPAYKEIDGGIYTKDGKILLADAIDYADVVLPEGLVEIKPVCLDGYNCMQNVRRLTLPDSLVTIGSRAVCDINKLKFISIPPNLGKVPNHTIYDLPKLEEIHFRGTTPPEVEDYGIWYLGKEVKAGVEKVAYVPTGSKAAYESSTVGQHLTKDGYVFKESYEPTECLELAIIADDVLSSQPFTRIQYTARTTGRDLFTKEPKEGEVIITGELYSKEFGINENDTVVEREISFTYLGVTATTTIMQDAASDSKYEIEIVDGEWMKCQEEYIDDALYDVYKLAKNKGVKYETNTLMIKLSGGFEKFQIYLRGWVESYGSTNYLTLSQLDSTAKYYTTRNVNEFSQHRNSQDVLLEEATLIEYLNVDEEEHIITAKYSRGNYASSREDMFIIIPKFQK